MQDHIIDTDYCNITEAEVQDYLDQLYSQMGQ